METADRPSCASCTHRMGENGRYATCRLYPRDEVDRVTGEQSPPYRHCYKVLEITTRNPLDTCQHYRCETPRQMRLVLEEVEG